MSALDLLAEHWKPEQATLLLAGGPHPDLHPGAVIQPHRRLRRALACADYDNHSLWPQVLVCGTANRRETRAYLELASRACSPGGRILFCLEKRLGADSWQKRLNPSQVISRYHCKLMYPDPATLQGDGHPCRLAPPHPEADFVSCPGLFSWDRLDPGSALLARHLPAEMPGRGAEFGCGPGLLTRILLQRGPHGLVAVDVDQRAVEACKRNNPAGQLTTLWLDVRDEQAPGPFHWVVLNPPFHEHGQEARELGQQLVMRAVQGLVTGGELWLVANRMLAYEELLSRARGRLEFRHIESGFKVLRWRRSA